MERIPVQEPICIFKFLIYNLPLPLRGGAVTFNCYKLAYLSLLNLYHF